MISDMKVAHNIFKSSASYPEHALVVMFDLEEFSKFFSQPDVQMYVPKYLNSILNCMNIIIYGGEAYWYRDEKDEPTKYNALPIPLHIKFLGDGMLYIWKFNDFKKDNIVEFINRLWNLKISFDDVVEKCSEDVPVIDIPKNIRFGISAGSVYKLTYQNSKRDEYIGYSINLASRLQNYCKELGFIVSGRVTTPKKLMDENKYTKAVASKLEGFPNEIVYVDSSEFDLLDESLKSRLFVILPK